MSNHTSYPIRFWLNEREMHIEVRATQTLLELLREDLHQWDVKMSCGKGDCGSCTVLLNGETRLSCLTLAVQAHETNIATAAGLGTQAQLHPLQEAFLRCGAVQCGFCTPGMLMTAKALLDQQPHPTRAQIREAISGNLCRCTGYQAIVDAIEAASQQSRNRVGASPCVRPLPDEHAPTGTGRTQGDAPTLFPRKNRDPEKEGVL